jgi:YVTN family beta-propeller protein
MVTLAPAHDRAFVANSHSGCVSVIDLKQRRRIANIGCAPPLDRVAEIDVTSWKLVDWLTTGNEPDGLGCSPLPLQPAALRLLPNIYV